MAILSEAGGVFETIGDKGWEELGQIRNELKENMEKKPGAGTQSMRCHSKAEKPTSVLKKTGIPNHQQR